MPIVKSRKPTGDTYSVVQVGRFFEVRRQTYRDGWRDLEQRVDTLPSEMEAEKLARALMEEGDES